ncbi:hypothetical protein Bpfe_004817 [Biomphalaria pfeifferi]|uniref:Uncharacterized protein n=1 Tax=Biomphalaria pfeifferi TaxID=112525 RepID=A0AAD8FIX0_BIOPF|nr:hypothetical protein Bpfe_004817 [Biomphalaria pfeifferi]
MVLPEYTLEDLYGGYETQSSEGGEADLHKHLIGSKVYDIKTRLDVLWRKVHNKYKQTRDIHKLTFIVSHPHGCPKHISIGRWVEKYHVTNFVCKFSYTTSTCPGSSGAYVNIVGYDTCPYQPVHSGTLANNLNYSGFGIII